MGACDASRYLEAPACRARLTWTKVFTLGDGVRGSGSRNNLFFPSIHKQWVAGRIGHGYMYNK